MVLAILAMARTKSSLCRPLIGGTFANPAETFPKWFNTPFWRSYPYLLPSLIAASLSLVTTSIALFVLEETLAVKRTSPKQDAAAATISGYGSTDSDSDLDPQASDKMLSAKELLSIPAMRAVFISSGALTFAAACFNTVFVLMAYAPINQGGLAMSVSSRPFPNLMQCQ